jgi:hypothetical protein
MERQLSDDSRYAELGPAGEARQRECSTWRTMSRSLRARLRSNRATVLSLLLGAMAPVLAPPLLCQQRLPTWSLEPELRLGALDGPYAFAALGPVVVSPRTGNVFVGESPGHILAFDSTGKKLSAFGRVGDGPGEFRNLADIYWSEGHIVAFDAGSSRVSWFTEDGGLVESRRIEPDPHSGAGMHASPWAPLGDGAFVGMVQQNLPDGKLMQLHVRLLRMDERGNDSILDQFPDVGRHFRTADGIWIPIPMVPGAHYAADPWGSTVVVVHQYAPQSEDSGTFRVRRIGADGKLVFSRTYGYTPSPISEEYMEEFFETRREGAQRFGLSTSEMERIVNRYVPDFFTPIREVRAGVDGSIWLRRQTEDTDEAWWVLNRRGDLVAQLHPPQGLRIRYVDAETVWGIELDSLGVNYLVKYGIVRE